MDAKKVLTGRRRPSRTPPRQWTPRRKAWYEFLTPSYVVVVCYTPFRGFCVRSVYPRGGSPLDRLLVFPPPEFSVKRVELRQQASGKTLTHLAARDCAALGDFPNLKAHAAVTRYEDGSSRKTGWWTVKTQGAAWCVQVKDPDSCCSFVATAQTLLDAFALADLLLGSTDAPWEPDPFLKKQKGK